ncbi:MAG: class I SAM-dependent methyltransferase [Phycisphaeraceae bacterium]|nr:MAG: class I SAM-dependent methyltransferase [Phycisphaeraceae bacterium]
MAVREPSQIREHLGELARTRPDYQGGGLRDPDTILCSDLTEGERFGLLAALREAERRAERDGRACRYLEIGVLAGGTIHFLKRNCRGTEFTGVDLFEDWRPDEENTHMSGSFRIADVQAALGPDVRLIKGAWTEVAPALEGERFDVVFIDANHAYEAVKEDFGLVRPLLRPGASVGFHNCAFDRGPDLMYVDTDGGPWKFTQELRRDPSCWMSIEKDRLRVFEVE